MSPNETTTVVTTAASPAVYLLRRSFAATVLVAAVAASVVAGAAASELLAGRASTADSVTATGPAGRVEPAPAAGGEVGADRDDGPAGPAGRDTAPAAGAGAVTSAPSSAARPGAGLSPRASRLVAQSPTRALDTRQDGQPPPADTTHGLTVDGNPEAVALSVTLLASERSGSVIIDGLAGSVEAVAVTGAGASVTNLVIVPVVGSELTLRSSAGGHLVVDVVGTFASAADGSAEGRFVPVEPVRVADLDTALDGRTATLALPIETVGPSPSALLVEIVADVGSDGGVVRLGPADGVDDQMLMWGPSDADADARQRRGLALVEPGEDGIVALAYEGGTALTADVIGYFTPATAEVAAAGLYVPSGPQVLYRGPIGPDDPVTVSGVQPSSGVAVATVSARSSGAGRLWSVTTPVTAGSIRARASAPLDATVTLLGVFLADD